VYQSTARNQPQLDLFRERVPHHPYCTDDLGAGLHIRNAQRALKSRYIQPNGPTHKFWLVFDVDRPGALYDWNDRSAPPPNIAVINPDNHHGHLIYGLEVPVRTATDGRPEPIRYAGAVDVALAGVLDADLGYSGLICKNPLHDHWQAHVWEQRLYSLDDLASWLDLSAFSDRRKRLPAYGLGRNCTLFDRLRHWAYKAIRQGWPDYERWLLAVEQRALAYNDFDTPLPRNEVLHTAKSVARFTHSNFSLAGFSAWQAARGRKGGLVSKGGGRPSRMMDLMPKVQEMILAGYDQSAIAEDLGITTRTLRNWLKRAD